MAGLLRAPGRPHAGHRAARAVRPARAPAHPRHPRRPARHAARRDRRRGRRGRRRERRDGRHDLPAAAVRAGRRDRPHRPRDRASLAARLRPRAVLGGDPPGLRAVRVRAARRRPAASTPTRSPAASSPTCASRRSRSGLGEKFEQIEDMYAAADRILGNIVKVTPSSKVVGDLALHLVAVGADPGGLRGRPRQVRHPRLGHRLPVRRARRPAGRLAGAVPHQGARRDAPWKAPEPSSTAEQRQPRWRPTGGVTLNALLFPGPTKDFAEARETLRRRVGAADPRLPLRAARRARSTRSRSRRASRCSSGSRRSASPTSAAIRTVMCTINGQLRPVQRARPRRSPPTSPPPRRPTRASPATSPRRSGAS